MERDIARPLEGIVSSVEGNGNAAVNIAVEFVLVLYGLGGYKTGTEPRLNNPTGDCDAYSASIRSPEAIALNVALSFCADTSRVQVAAAVQLNGQVAGHLDSLFCEAVFDRALPEPTKPGSSYQTHQEPLTIDLAKEDYS